MQLNQILGLLGGLLSFIAYIPYWYSIYRKGVRPQRATWLIWILSDFLVLYASIKLGASDGLPVLVVYFSCTIITFIMSIKKGEGGLHWLDMMCFLVALLSAFVWYKTGDPFVALLINLAMVVVGIVPTIKKIFKDPYSEDLFAYFFWFLGNLATLIAVLLSENCTLKLWLPSAVFLFVQLFVTYIVFIGRKIDPRT